MTGTNIKQIVVKRDGDLDIKFVGKLMASSESSRSDGSIFYSGSSNHWTELKLFETKGGKFVCQRIERSSWGNQRDQYEADVCVSENQVFDFFGHDVIAKELYDEAGFEAVVEVE